MNKLPLALALLVMLPLPGCAKALRPTPAPLSEERVLIVVNDNSKASVKIGAYYALKRHIPASYICHVQCPEQEEISEDVFTDAILAPVATLLAQEPQSSTVQYLVLTKGVPLRIHSDVTPADPRFSPNGDSVDGRLMTQDIAGMASPAINPYFNSPLRFSHAKFGLYLATRLDGYTVADAEALVDRALAAKPAKGTFLLDVAPSRSGGGDPANAAVGIKTNSLNGGLVMAAATLRSRHLTVMLDESLTFVGNIPHLMGYWSWGSNDPQFDVNSYKGNTYRPGAIAETAVSTSARTMLPGSGGQSLIADLVESGVTGVKGYVAEPYTLAMAHPEILFDRYTKGWNLAESFYCASLVTHWKDVVLGDPLCAPYAKAAK